MPTLLHPIPSKRYFTIGEVSELCGIKPHVLRYWEQEFPQLKPIKRRTRRYYQHHEVLLVRRICDLLYDQGFTISGARQQLTSNHQSQETLLKEFSLRSSDSEKENSEPLFENKSLENLWDSTEEKSTSQLEKNEKTPHAADLMNMAVLRYELLSIRRILEED